MNPTVHLIHGIRDNGAGTTRVLGYVLGRMGYNVRVHKLTRTHTWHAWSPWWIAKLSREVMPFIEMDDIVICHSNGANVLWRMLRIYAKIFAGPYISKIVLLSPAMNRRQKFSKVHFDKLLCIHNPTDFAIWFGSIIPTHRFGLAGAFGFSTRDPRVLNETRLSFVGPFNHTSPYFQEPYVEQVALRIHRFLSQE